MTDPAAPRHVVIVAGTRPEALKLAPVVTALRHRPEDFRVTLLSTGQHREMLTQAFDAFGLTPDVRLDVMQPDQSLPALTSALLAGCHEVFMREGPDLVLVQGDTSSAFAAALVAYYCRIAVGHIEAGLRTGDPHNPFPEEMNRRLVTPIAALHFAPTARAARALRREGVPQHAIHRVGNTIVDALLTLRGGAAGAATPAIKELVATSAGQLVLVTCHRRESLGADLETILAGIRVLAERFPERRFLFPVHLNPNVRGQVMPRLAGLPNVTLSDPISYADLLHVLAGAELVITDSGGLQEEAPSFGVPVLVLRRTTERPEGIKAGFARLVRPGQDDLAGIATRWLREDRRARLKELPNPYGDGKAAARIATIIAEWAT